MDDSIAARLKRVDALMAGQGGPGSATRVASFSVEELRTILADPAAPLADRRAALADLTGCLRGEPELSEILLARLDDPEVDLAREAIAAAPPFDVRVRDRVRALLDSPRPEIWEAAASALARKKDHAILPRMLAWAREGDAPHRRAGLAAVAFLLIPEEHLAVVESICEEGPRDEEDEAVLVDALRVAEARVRFWLTAAGAHHDPTR